MPVRKIKNVTSIMIVLLFAVLWHKDLNACQISAGSDTFFLPTEQANIPIELSLDINDNVAALQFDLDFDSDNLTLDSVTIGDSALQAEKQVQFALIDENTVRFILYETDENIAHEDSGGVVHSMGDGIIANFIFSLSPPTSPGVTDIVLSQAVVSDTNASVVSSTTSNGTIVITTSGISETPKEFILYQNIPNPFNQNTTIYFDLPREVNVCLKIYSVDGVLVRTLINNRRMQVGSHEIIWDGRDNYGKATPAGTYLQHLAAGDFSGFKKMIFVK